MKPTATSFCARTAIAATLLAAAALLAGCSSPAMIDSIPTALGGLPEGVPARPAAPPAYPNVHEMPPARTDTALSDAEKKRLREDLTGARDRTAQ